MTRTVRDATLESRSARLRMTPSAKPRYRAIEAGLHLGYRRSKTSGKRIVRFYLGKGRYELETLGLADERRIQTEPSY